MLPVAVLLFISISERCWKQDMDIWNVLSGLHHSRHYYVLSTAHYISLYTCISWMPITYVSEHRFVFPSAHMYIKYGCHCEIYLYCDPEVNKKCFGSISVYIKHNDKICVQPIPCHVRNSTKTHSATNYIQEGLSNTNPSIPFMYHWWTVTTCTFSFFKLF